MSAGWQVADIECLGMARGLGEPGWQRREYARLRALGWPAQDAWRAAKVRRAFAAECACVWGEGGPELLLKKTRARVVTLPEDCCWGDSFDFPDTATGRRDKERLAARIEREGYWAYGVEVRDADGRWELVDNCGGFVGEDWLDSGYDVDMMSAALERLREVDEAISERVEVERLVADFADVPGADDYRVRLARRALRLDVACHDKVALALRALGDDTAEGERCAG